MNIFENLRKMNFSFGFKKKEFTHATFIYEEITSDKLCYVFLLTNEHIPFSIDIAVKGKNTIQFMTGTNNGNSLEQLDGKIEDILEWFYNQICSHPLFRLRIATNGIRFKFVKANGNILYHHQLPFFLKK